MVRVYPDVSGINGEVRVEYSWKRKIAIKSVGETESKGEIKEDVLSVRGGKIEVIRNSEKVSN